MGASPRGLVVVLVAGLLLAPQQSEGRSLNETCSAPESHPSWNR
jgi:hypothetical protein